MILTITIRCTTRRYGASSWISGHFDTDPRNPPGGDDLGRHDALRQQRCRRALAWLEDARAAKLKRCTSSAPKAVPVSRYPWAGRTPAHGCSVGGHKASVGGRMIIGAGQRYQPVASLPANRDGNESSIGYAAIAAAAEMRHRGVVRRGRMQLLSRSRLRTSRRMPGQSENRSPSSAK